MPDGSFVVAEDVRMDQALKAEAQSAIEKDLVDVLDRLRATCTDMEAAETALDVIQRTLKGVYLRREKRSLYRPRYQVDATTPW